MRRAGFVAIWAVLAVLPTRSGLAAPPFNCSIATEAAEIAVCDSEALGVLDREMNRLYQVKRAGLKTEGKAEAADALRLEQRAFLKTRDACSYDVACLTNLFKQRNQLLGKP